MSIAENNAKLKSYLNKVKNGYGLTNKDKAEIMETFYKIHDKLFDKEFSFKTSEISQPPISITYHQLSKILFLYYLKRKQNKSLVPPSQPAKVIIDEFNSMKYSPTIINYLDWLKNDFYDKFIKPTIVTLKNTGSPEFKQFLATYNVRVSVDIPFHNAINLVLLYGQYLDLLTTSTLKNEYRDVLNFYRRFIDIKNNISNILGKYNVSSLYPIAPENAYSEWERPMYNNYYFQYMKYLSDFYDLGYNNLSKYFLVPQYFTYRLLNNHLIMTGFDNVNLTDNEYIIYDTELLPTRKMLLVHNIIGRAGVTVKETIKRLGNKDTKDLMKTYDSKNLLTMTYNSTSRTFTMLSSTGINVSQGSRKVNRTPIKDVEMHPTRVLEIVKMIKIEIAETKIKGDPKPKMVLKVYLNDDFLYVFFKRNNVFNLMRRCDQRVIGSVSETAIWMQKIVPTMTEEISYVKVNKMFPFEFVLFNACCQALLSKFSQTLDNLTTKFFRQIQQTFKPLPKTTAQNTTTTTDETSNTVADTKCLYVYNDYPYLRNEYVALHQ
jgi:hypothetical protein